MRGQRFHVLILVASVCIGIALPLAAPAATTAPVRSGTIIGSTAAIYEGQQGCHQTPDCLAWLAADCDARLAGLDPAPMASIVDVRALAGTTRRLVIAFPYGGWLDSVYEFWSASCIEVGQFYGSSQWFRVPTGATWMTIPSTGVGAFRWAIY